MYLESDLLRVVGFKLGEDRAAHISTVYGTAFLVGRDGVFLTAAHVIRAALAGEDNGLVPGIVGMGEDGTKVAILHGTEFAPNGQDVAIGRSAYRFSSWYRIGNGEYHVWQRVASAGYPGEAVIDTEESLTIPLRAFKGIIQRVIGPGELALAPATIGYELSFVPSPGVSGAPLFVYREAYGEVIGVCVGAFKSELVEDEITEVQKNGSRYTEKRVRVTQFGLAEALSPLMEWRPAALGGASLGDLVAG